MYKQLYNNVYLFPLIPYFAPIPNHLSNRLLPKYQNSNQSEPNIPTAHTNQIPVQRAMCVYQRN
jgi:hypothetical protein